MVYRTTKSKSLTLHNLDHSIYPKLEGTVILVKMKVLVISRASPPLAACFKILPRRRAAGWHT